MKEGNEQRDGRRQRKSVATGPVDCGRVSGFINALVLLVNVVMTVVEMREVVA